MNLYTIKNIPYKQHEKLLTRVFVINVNKIDFTKNEVGLVKDQLLSEAIRPADWETVDAGGGELTTQPTANKRQTRVGWHSSLPVFRTFSQHM